MQTKKFELLQTDGWVALTDAATQVLVQLRTEGRVEIVSSTLEPTTAPVQGLLLTSAAFPVFSATGLGVTDIIWARIVGGQSDTDTLIVMDNGNAPVGPA